MLLVLSLLLMLQAPSVDAPSPRSEPDTVLGTVVGADQRPVPRVIVFAVDPRTASIALMVASDEQGRVRLRLAPGSHRFGVMSPHLGVERLVNKGPAEFVLVLRPLPPPAGAAPAEGTEAPVVRTPGALLIQGRVVDESGAGLAGVRVDGLRATEWEPRAGKMRAGGVVVVSSALSGTNGAFNLAIPGGDTQIQARAPGLLLVRSSNLLDQRRQPRADRPILVMGIDAAAQEIIVSERRVLRIHLEDSIDPEYSPPAPVRAWLQYAYGICPPRHPLTVREKQALQKYWYLHVLRADPPSPASISAGACIPPAAHAAAPLTVRAGFGSVAGFDIVNELP